MQIFLSYASEDRSLAEQIQLALLADGHKVFFDREALQAGGDYDGRIGAALVSSDLLVFLVGEHSVDKGSYALTELKHARLRWPHPKGRVLPVLVEPVPFNRIPAYLKAVTLLEPEGNAPAEVRAAVSVMVGELMRDDSIAGTTTAQGIRVSDGVGHGSTLGSLVRRVVAAAWPVRLAIGVLCVSAVVAFASPQLAMKLVQLTSRLPRVALSAGPGLPLKENLRQSTQETANRLAAVVGDELLKMPSRAVSTWSLAEDVTAIDGIVPIEKRAVSDYFRQNSDPICGCWTELIDKPGDSKFIVTSGWVLFAMARLGVPATPAERRFLISQQQAQGAWSVYPVAGNDGFASTFATAWALLGLHSQRVRALVPPDEMAAVDGAIRKGVTWLLSVRVRGEARWAPYPARPDSQPSESLSGTVLHALHMMGTPDIESIDRRWLETLPDTVPNGAEVSYVVIKTTTIEAIDNFEQVRMPWMLAATVDAYPRGSWLQRAAALRWVEATLTHETVTSADTLSKPWWRAETLYALRWVLR